MIGKKRVIVADFLNEDIFDRSPYSCGHSLAIAKSQQELRHSGYSCQCAKLWSKRFDFNRLIQE